MLGLPSPSSRHPARRPPTPLSPCSSPLVAFRAWPESGISREDRSSFLRKCGCRPEEVIFLGKERGVREKKRGRERVPCVAPIDPFPTLCTFFSAPALAPRTHHTLQHTHAPMAEFGEAPPGGALHEGAREKGVVRAARLGGAGCGHAFFFLLAPASLALPCGAPRGPMQRPASSPVPPAQGGTTRPHARPGRAIARAEAGRPGRRHAWKEEEGRGARRGRVARCSLRPARRYARPGASF